MKRWDTAIRRRHSRMWRIDDQLPLNRSHWTLECQDARAGDRVMRAGARAITLRMYATRKGWPLRLHVDVNYVQDEEETAMTRRVTVKRGPRFAAGCPPRRTWSSARR